MNVLALSAAGVRVDVELVGVAPRACEALSRIWDGCDATATDAARLSIRADAAPTAAPVLVPETDADERFRAILAGESASPGAQPPAVGERPGPHDVVAATVAELSAAIVARVTALAIDRCSTDTTPLHAAGVAVGGRVVAFVGRSGAGKSTIACTVGGCYVSDEMLAVTASGLVLPYPKPLSVVAAQGPKTQHAPAAFGLRPVRERLPLGAIVLLDRDPEARTPSLTPVALHAALPELVPQVSHLARRSDGLSRLAQLVAMTGPIQRLRYRDAEQVRDLLPRLVDAGSAVDNPEPRYGRRTADWVCDEGRVLALTDGSVHVLSPAGTRIWLALDRPMGQEGLAAALGVRSSVLDVVLPELCAARLLTEVPAPRSGLA